MADEVDIANEQADRWLHQSLATLAAQAPGLKPKGCCHYCEEPFDPADPNFAKKLFCDSECAHGHSEEIRLKKLR